MSTVIEYLNGATSQYETFAIVTSTCPFCGESVTERLTFEGNGFNEKLSMVFYHGEEHTWKVPYVIRLRLEVSRTLKWVDDHYEEVT